MLMDLKMPLIQPLQPPKHPPKCFRLHSSGQEFRFECMSFAQIIEEIPKLTHLERRELFLQVLSLEPDADDIAVCDHVAREGFSLLDEMEAADSTHG